MLELTSVRAMPNLLEAMGQCGLHPQSCAVSVLGTDYRGVLGPISDTHGECGPVQGIGKLESEMQQLRGNLANFATTMASLRGVASAAPSQCAPPACKNDTTHCSRYPQAECRAVVSPSLRRCCRVVGWQRRRWQRRRRCHRQNSAILTLREPRSQTLQRLLRPPVQPELRQGGREGPCG